MYNKLIQIKNTMNEKLSLMFIICNSICLSSRLSALEEIFLDVNGNHINCYSKAFLCDLLAIKEIYVLCILDVLPPLQLYMIKCSTQVTVYIP